MSIFQALGYFLIEAVRNLVRGWRISSLAIATTALSLFIGGLLILAGSNLASAVERWRSDAQIVVYFEDGVEQSEIERTAAELRARPRVERVDELTSRQAQERFRERFPDLDELLVEFERSPFPASLEVQVEAEGRAGGWIEDLRKRPGVAEVDDDARWLASLDAAAALASGLGLVIGGILMLAAAVSIASVVRLSTFVYRKEIAAMRLIGATEFFVRGPFVVEGLVQGLAGSCAALAGLWIGYWSLGRLEIPWFVHDALLGSFLSPWQAAALLALGCAAGLVGAIVPLRERAGVFG